MSTLTRDPGPSLTEGRSIPSKPEERDPHRWLVFGPTFVFAANADNHDQAIALVLVALGYEQRPWLRENLDARQANRDEIAAVCVKRRRPALRVTDRNARKVRACMTVIAADDRRKHGLSDEPPPKRRGVPRRRTPR